MSYDENFDFSQKVNRLIEVAKALAAKHTSIALYGNGLVGRIIAPYLKDKLVAVVDKSARQGDVCEGLTVQRPETLKSIGAECLVISVLGREEQIIDYLTKVIGWENEIYTFQLNSVPRLRSAVTAEDEEKLSRLRNKFSGERCFIVGNGPSLNQCDLSLLANEFTFGVNGIFYKTREMGFKPTFYVVEDNHVVDDNIKEINAYDCSYKLFPSVFKGQIKDTEQTYFFNYDAGFFMKSSPHFCKPRFSFDASKEVFAGQTVTYTNIQLACYLGFSEIYLIGVDFSYAVPNTTVIEGDTYISQEDDPNHFHPEYFGRGKKWHDPKLDRVFLNYVHARDVLQDKGVIIFNATKGGKLEVFPRVDFDSLFATKRGELRG